jgi:hypothetical protein
MGKSEGNRPLGTSRHGCEDNIKWILKKWNGVGFDYINVADGRHKGRAVLDRFCKMWRV